MTHEENLIIERLRATYADIDQMEKVFAIVTKTLALREAQIEQLKALLSRAADALESNQMPTSTSCVVFTLIAELRKAAQSQEAQ